VAGFVGRFLTQELLAAGHEVVGIDISLKRQPEGITKALCLDLTKAESILNALATLKPDACIHLGGIASPPVGRTNPEMMLNTNVLGTAHLLEALRQTAPQTRMLLASTSYVYGNADTESLITEDAPIRPNSVYAVSKASADLMTLAYSRDYDMCTMTARAANHTGPGQSPDFVVPAFARQIKAISEGTQPPVMRVGNLESKRTFMDVRDIVRGYRLLIEKGECGQAYNVASSERITMGHMLDLLCEAAGVSPEIEVDPERYRPTDRMPLLSTERLREATGWKPEIPFKQTLRDVLEQA